MEKHPDKKEIDNKKKKNQLSPASPFSTSKSLSWISFILLRLVLDPRRHNYCYYCYYYCYYYYYHYYY